MGEEAVEQMTVLVVEPGYAPYEKTIPHDVYAMQEIVGGPITSVYPYNEPVAIVANDEGILLGMDFNRSVEGGYGGLFGTFFVCGLTVDDFALYRLTRWNASRRNSIRLKFWWLFTEMSRSH